MLKGLRKLARLAWHVDHINSFHLQKLFFCFVHLHMLQVTIRTTQKTALFGSNGYSQHSWKWLDLNTALKFYVHVFLDALLS
jgi:hypothetical protein